MRIKCEIIEESKSLRPWMFTGERFYISYQHVPERKTVLYLVSTCTGERFYISYQHVPDFVWLMTLT